MHFYATERIALFIDGANLHAATKSLGFDIDFKRLLGVFAEKARLVRALYYTALVEDQEFSSLRPLVDWLTYNAFTVVTKPVKTFTDVEGRRKLKGNMDVELAVDAMPGFTSITSCCSQATRISAVWLPPCRNEASASVWCRASSHSRR